MVKKETKKSDVVARIIGIIVGIIIVLGISYALFQITLNGNKKNQVISGTLSVKIKEDDEQTPKKYTKIELLNTIPQTPEEGLKEDPYVFTLINDGNIDAKYTLKIEVGKTVTLPADFIDYAYKKADGEITVPKLLTEAPHEEGTSVTGNVVDLYTIDEGTINVGESIDYDFHMWLDSTAGNDMMSKDFIAILRVDGVQKNK